MNFKVDAPRERSTGEWDEGHMIRDPAAKAEVQLASNPASPFSLFHHGLKRIDYT
jgi:hypothetical protein